MCNKCKIEIYLEECDKSEFERLNNIDEVYFSNGVLFSDDDDNVVAFPVYTSNLDELETYFKVFKRIKND